MSDQDRSRLTKNLERELDRQNKEILQADIRDGSVVPVSLVMQNGEVQEADVTFDPIGRVIVPVSALRGRKIKSIIIEGKEHHASHIENRFTGTTATSVAVDLRDQT